MPRGHLTVYIVYLCLQVAFNRFLYMVISYQIQTISKRVYLKGDSIHRKDSQLEPNLKVQLIFRPRTFILLCVPYPLPCM